MLRRAVRWDPRLNDDGPPSDEHSLRCTQPEMPTPDFGGIFHCQIDKKGLELTLFRPQLTIGV